MHAAFESFLRWKMPQKSVCELSLRLVFAVFFLDFVFWKPIIKYITHYKNNAFLCLLFPKNTVLEMTLLVSKINNYAFFNCVHLIKCLSCLFYSCLLKTALTEFPIANFTSCTLNINLISFTNKHLIFKCSNKNVRT